MLPFGEIRIVEHMVLFISWCCYFYYTKYVFQMGIVNYLNCQCSP